MCHHPFFISFFNWQAQSLRLKGSCDLQLDNWCTFDVFKVSALTNSKPLQKVAMALLDHFDLVQKLQLDRGKLASFLKACASAYSWIASQAMGRSSPPKFLLQQACEHSIITICGLQHGAHDVRISSSLIQSKWSCLCMPKLLAHSLFGTSSKEQKTFCIMSLLGVSICLVLPTGD